MGKGRLEAFSDGVLAIIITLIKHNSFIRREQGSPTLAIIVIL